MNKSGRRKAYTYAGTLWTSAFHYLRRLSERSHLGKSPRRFSLVDTCLAEVCQKYDRIVVASTACPQPATTTKRCDTACFRSRITSVTLVDGCNLNSCECRGSPASWDINPILGSRPIVKALVWVNALTAASWQIYTRSSFLQPIIPWCQASVLCGSTSFTYRDILSHLSSSSSEHRNRGSSSRCG